jgi:hypothetical protein
MDSGVKFRKCYRIKVSLKTHCFKIDVSFIDI